MRLSEDIKPISYVKANTGKVLEQVNTSGPMVITRNGEASAVLIGVKAHDKMRESLALLKILSMGSKGIEEGKGIRPRLCSRACANAFARRRMLSPEGRICFPARFGIRAPFDVPEKITHGDQPARGKHSPQRRGGIRKRVRHPVVAFRPDDTANIPFPRPPAPIYGPPPKEA